ncbi:MAG: hypothetical protein JRE56_08790 [Deltaproteobacteria bacterium]|jgi:hypothetical protein|nr:hypothetical protein [Deltaproteobacteria bacterium]
MHVNKQHGFWGRCRAFGRELCVEVIGGDELFAAGQRQRMIGRLECYRGLNQAETEQQVDQLLS